jgi:diaminopimelate epimerase
VKRDLEFTKMHGAGNDFVVLDGIAAELPPIAPLVRRLADRHLGVGCDQLLVLRPSQRADLRMEIFDADGSQVEMCGNGVRAVFKYLRDRGRAGGDELRVETLGGIVRPRWAGRDLVAVDMGRPALAPAEIPTLLGEGPGPLLDVPLRVDGDELRVSCVSMGNPHAVLYVDDVDAAPVAELGPRIEHHPAFPKRVNVEFVEVLSRDRLRQRTWERGTGETLACGSGACAVAVASRLRGIAGRRVVIELRGGELEIEWDGDAGSVTMTGPAAEVFTGRIALGEVPPCSKES